MNNNKNNTENIFFWVRRFLGSKIINPNVHMFDHAFAYFFKLVFNLRCVENCSIITWMICHVAEHVLKYECA